MRLASGIAPIRAMRDAGVPVSIAVDGSASNDSGHMLGEARLALLLQRVAHGPVKGPQAMTAREVLEIATLGGAKALGLQEKMGHLFPGLEASFQVVTLPELPSVETLEKVLCTAGQNVTVTHLYLAAENVLLES